MFSRFVASVVETLRRNHLDGIDIDWEFPMDINNGKAHFTRLLQVWQGSVLSFQPGYNANSAS